MYSTESFRVPGLTEESHKRRRADAKERISWGVIVY